MIYRVKDKAEALDKKITIIKWILLSIVLLYIVIPPYDKLAQFGYLYNNTSNQQEKDFLFHRNNAVYMLRMNKSKAALKEIDIALTKAPINLNKSELDNLYKDKAFIELYFKDYKAALNDYLRTPNLTPQDYLTIAMLFKKIGKHNEALRYCNKILDYGVDYYSAYACFADIYNDAGKPEVSVAVYDILISRTPNKYQYYLDRADYKKITGDIAGANADIEKAKDLYPLASQKKKLTEICLEPNSYALALK